MVDELSGKEFEAFTKKGLVVVDFFAEWCMPCIMLAPVIEEISDKMKKIKFGKVNIDDSRDISEEFAVMSVPTLIVFKDGKEVDRIVGSLPSDVLEERLSKFL